MLTNPTSDEPINAVTDARIVEILKGDFLEADDLISRADFKGPSGAVFRNVTEKRAVANVMWKKLCIARVLNVSRSALSCAPEDTKLTLVLNVVLSVAERADC